jgi:hypothetical protein
VLAVLEYLLQLRVVMVAILFLQLLLQLVVAVAVLGIVSILQRGQVVLAVAVAT